MRASGYWQSSWSRRRYRLYSELSTSLLGRRRRCCSQSSVIAGIVGPSVDPAFQAPAECLIWIDQALTVGFCALADIDALDSSHVTNHVDRLTLVLSLVPLYEC
jgi:hypothetical protein